MSISWGTTFLGGRVASARLQKLAASARLPLRLLDRFLALFLAIRNVPNEIVENLRGVCVCAEDIFFPTKQKSLKKMMKKRKIMLWWVQSKRQRLWWNLSKHIQTHSLHFKMWSNNFNLGQNLRHPSKSHPFHHTLLVAYSLATQIYARAELQQKRECEKIWERDSLGEKLFCSLSDIVNFDAFFDVLSAA